LDSPDVPSVVGYRLDRLIGEGGFGQVWHGHRDADGEAIAVKVLHLELVRSVDAMTRFQRELAAIERLNHPNVVRGLGHGTLPDGRPYLVLEFVEGPSLRELLHRRGALPPAEMLAILAPLCDALQAAHAAELVHRDVKASNVILAQGPAGVRPVLLDFGLVKLTDQTGPGLTSSRSMLGTPAAMAPEQMRGLPVDARTDIYALGLLAYHMLTGHPAFGGAPGVVQSYLQVHGPRPRPSSKVDIDPAIDEPIARALAPEASERFPDAQSFLDALRTVIHGTTGEELEVVALYVEGDTATITDVSEIVRTLGFTIGLIAPDSLLAVVPRTATDIATLREHVSKFSGSARIAIGLSRATIHGALVDGAALDVEGWAPWPLRLPVWVADGL
jgi:eukaryotic-like serine/threonine-protein kinase